MAGETRGGGGFDASLDAELTLLEGDVEDVKEQLVRLRRLLATLQSLSPPSQSAPTADA